MSEDATLAVAIGGIVVAVFGVVAWRVYGWRLLWWVMSGPFWLSWKALKLTGFAGARAFTAAGARRVSDPTDAELVGRRTVEPGRRRGLRDLRHGLHDSAGGMVEAVHKVVVGMTGCAKNQTDVNYEIQHQLEHSDEHLIVTDVKASAELSKIIFAYARPEDRIFVYSFHPGDRCSSSLRLFKDPGEAADLAYMLTDEPGAKDSHWNEKAAELIEAASLALTGLSGEAERAAASLAGEEVEEVENRENGEITATLNEVRDAVVDRRKLEELRSISPVVDNVADEPKEWGYIRSTAARRLTALSNPVVRRVFAGRPDTPQPDFSRRDGRDIVIVRPHAQSAKRLSRYIYAVLDVLYRAAADGGDAGGPGVKVIIDEAASYMRLENLNEYLDLGRGSRVQLTFVLQSLKQLMARLGRESAEHVIGSTELKVIGATSDTETARFISELSGRSRVRYRRPRQREELLGHWGEEERAVITSREITAQTEGEWTLQRGPEVWKVKVPKRCYHHTQAAEPADHPLWGVVDPEEYRVPPVLGPSTEKPERDGSGDRHDPRSVGDSRRDRDDILDDGRREDGGEWIA